MDIDFSLCVDYNDSIKHQEEHIMINPKLIICDIDGTLLPMRTEILPDDLKQTIQSVVDRGYFFALNTGRQYSFVRDIFLPLLDRIYIVCQSGSTMYHNDRLLLHRPLPRALCMQIEAYFSSLPGREYIASTEKGYYYIGKGPVHEKMQRIFKAERMVPVESVSCIPEEICQMTLYDFDDIAARQQGVAQMLHGAARASVGSDLCLDITVGDKATGTRALCEQLGIDVKDAVAFGDNYNDVPMLRVCGEGYIMSHASEELKKMIPLHCPDVHAYLRRLL